MAIDVLIVKEDLNTVVTMFNSIDSNEDYYQLMRVARSLKLNFVSTIDEAGDTVINRLQEPLMTKEIQQLRARADIKHEIIDEIDKALTYLRFEGPHLYLKFMGD